MKRELFVTVLMGLLSSCAVAHPRLNSEQLKEMRDEAYQVVRRGDAVAFKGFLDRGFPVDYGKRESDTPLRWAAELGKFEIAKMLIERGADVNARNFILETPLHGAVYFGHIDVVRLFLEHKADPNIGGGVSATTGEKYDDPPLYWAARKGFFDIVKLLLEYGGNPGQKDSQGMTPFHAALFYNHKEIAVYLFSHAKKLDVNTRDPYLDSTPLQLAIAVGADELAKELIRQGADVNAKTRYSAGAQTPLHYAARSKNRELVELLLSKGADPLGKSKDGLTPIDEAEKAGNAEIAQLLRASIRTKTAPSGPDR